LGAKISHLDNPSGAKSLSSADGTSRAWVPLAEAGNVAVGGLVDSDQLINDALKVVLQEDEIVGESGSNPLAPLQSKIINLGQQLYKALFQGPSNRVGSKLKKLPKQNKKYCSCA